MNAPSISVPRPRTATPRFDALYYGVFAGCLVPLFETLFYWAEHGTRSMLREVSVVLNQFGYVGLVLLMTSLACTPVRAIFGVSWPARLRKLLGLFAFFYVALHMLTYTGLIQGFDLWEVLSESFKRPFLIFGMLAFLLLIPLAVTSTNAMIRRLGGKRWRLLHRLVYVIVVLGVIHFYLRIKGHDHREPLIVGGIVVVLLAIRMLNPPTINWRKKAK